MSDLLLVMLAFLALAALDFRVTRANMGSPWNGYGAMLGALHRNNQAPMRYRVLMAWTVGRLPDRYRLAGYLAVKYALLALAFAAAYPLLGGPGLVLLALLLATALEFEYWDCYGELAAVGLCLSGEPWLVALGGALWATSRETWPLAVPLALFAGGPWAALASLSAPLAWAFIRYRQGYAPRYCEWWTMRAYNLPDLRLARRRLDAAMLTSLLWAGPGLALIVARRAAMPAPLALTAWAVPAWIVAAWLFGRARETRTILPAALWIAASLGG